MPGGPLIRIPFKWALFITLQPCVGPLVGMAVGWFGEFATALGQQGDLAEQGKVIAFATRPPGADDRA